jgi:uncharacterized membrane protein SpoIIM required for sporulation
MKESSFINQNKENWKHYEKVLNGKSSAPDELNDLFIQVTDDLSYSRSNYPNRSVRVYLNGLAQKVFLKLYTNRKRKKSFLGTFFRHELPAILYSVRKEMLVSFLVFCLTFMIGVFSSRQQPGFASQILGESYIEMTNQNIREGKPMNVYAEGDKLSAFLRIAYNNLRVDMLTFVTGLFFSIGTLFVLAYNGVMVGVFQYLFYGSGYFTFTILTIWLHGTLEIFTIILSATAGLVFGKGLIFPGTYSRLQAFRISAMKGIKLIFAVIPITLTAAFIEAFITGQTLAPAYLKITLIVASLGFIMFYFVWLPWYKFSGKELDIDDADLPPHSEPALTFNDIKTVGDIIADTFRSWRSLLVQITGISILISAIIVFITYFTENTHLEYQFFNRSSSIFTVIPLLKINLWFRDNYYTIWPLTIFIISLFILLFHIYFYKKYIWINTKLLSKLSAILTSLTLYLLGIFTFYFYDGIGYFLLFYFLIFPLFINMQSNLLENGFRSIFNGIYYFFQSFFSTILINLILLILMFIFYLLVSSPIVTFLIESLRTGLKISDGLILEIEKIAILLIGISTLLISIPLYIFGNTIHYFSTKEKLSGAGLRRDLTKIWTNQF